MEDAISSRFRNFSENITFYKDARSIMISGLADPRHRFIETGSIIDNIYIARDYHIVDHLFGVNYKGRGYFFAQPNCDSSKIILYGLCDLNDQPDDGTAVIICNKDYKKLFANYFSDTLIGKCAWSFDGTWVAFDKHDLYSHDNNREIVCLPLSSEKGEKFIDSLSSLTLLQIRLLYQLCCARMAGLTVGLKHVNGDDFALFETIPLEIRKFLSRYLFNERPTGKERSECTGNECVIL